MKTPNLSKTERLILANQNRILARLIDNESEYYTHLAEIVEHGYEGLYYELFDKIYDGLSREICDETFDILTMYMVVHNTIKSLPDNVKNQPGLEKLEFEGFDANNDPHYHFMEFIITKETRYEIFKDRYRNSHTISSIRKHRVLLNKYRELTKDPLHTLTLADLTMLINEL